jgi:hypothetical protein
MTIENDFLPFAVGGSANVLTQAAYAALTSLQQNGFQSGIANSQQLNKVWRQSSIMAAVLSQFIVDQSGQAAIDDGTTATLEANLLSAIRNAAKQQVVLNDTGTTNAYVAANTPPLTALPTSSGLVQRVSIAHANTGASTYAPDGLTAKPIYGLNLSALQGSELVVNGIATMMYLVAPTVNGGNGAWILLECTGGALQIPPATQPQHAVQFGQVAGVVGSARNLKMSVTAASASAALAADEIIVETALGGLRYCPANFNKTINLATIGAGGMDTGTAPVSGFVALYAIYNPTTGMAALLATNTTSAVAPSVYGGPSMPAGYIASALVSVWATNATGQFVVGYQSDRSIATLAVAVLTTSTPVSTQTPLAISGVVPLNARLINGYVIASSTATSNLAVNLYPNANQIGGAQETQFGGSAANASQATSFTQLQVVTPGAIGYTFSSTAGTPTLQINVNSYTF